MPDEVKTLAADAGFGASAIIAKNEPYAKASPTRGGGIERSDDDGEVYTSPPFVKTTKISFSFSLGRNSIYLLSGAQCGIMDTTMCSHMKWIPETTF